MGKFDIKGWTAGLMLRLAGKALPPVPHNSAMLAGWMMGGKIVMARSGKAEKTPVAYLYGTPSEGGNVILKTGDVYTTYNGCVLSPFPKRNTQTHPYAVLVWEGGLVQHYTVFFTPTITYGTSNAGNWCFGFGAGTVAYYMSTSGEWKLLNEYADGFLYGTADSALWSNADILFEDGKVCLAASDPIPIYTGLVANSYNGARIPVLPEEIGKYPYAAIHYSEKNAADGKPFAQLYMMDATCVLAGSIVSGYQLTGTVVCYNWIADESTIEWSGLLGLPEGMVANKWVHRSTKSGENVTVFHTAPTWANFDVLKYDGTLIVAAAAPVPVYE